MLQGETHDLMEKKGDIRFYYAGSIFFAVAGVILFIVTFTMDEVLALIAMGSLSCVILFLSYTIYKNIQKLDKYIVYGIDDNREVLWQALMQKDNDRPLETFEIPFSSITTVLLAPFQSDYMPQVGPEPRTRVYFDIPHVVIVFKAGSEKKWYLVHFKEDDGANSWIDRAINVGLRVEVTDEAINKVLRDPQGPELIEDGIYKQKLDFNGDVSSYINRKNKRDHSGPVYSKEKTKKTDEFYDSIRTFPLKIWHIFALQCLMLFMFLSLDMWWNVTNVSMATTEMSILGVVAISIVLIVGQLLFGYAVKNERVEKYFLYGFLSGMSWLLILALSGELFNLNYFERIFTELIVYAIAFLPVMLMMHQIRKWLPADHQDSTEMKKKRMRYRQDSM
ncbi:hypothetical protein ACM26V_09520 [Salipaludibacillus sp. HK11]|uniref:hypothetical protein n=1 Tax=Salipaludibacillus sp. HK11 TaxID=3394320 RepID=UPI0039FC30E6